MLPDCWLSLSYRVRQSWLAALSSSGEPMTFADAVYVVSGREPSRNECVVAVVRDRLRSGEFAAMPPRSPIRPVS